MTETIVLTRKCNHLLCGKGHLWVPDPDSTVSYETAWCPVVKYLNVMEKTGHGETECGLVKMLLDGVSYIPQPKGTKV